MSSNDAFDVVKADLARRSFSAASDIDTGTSYFNKLRLIFATLERKRFDQGVGKRDGRWCGSRIEWLVEFWVKSEKGGIWADRRSRQPRNNAKSLVLLPEVLFPYLPLLFCRRTEVAPESLKAPGEVGGGSAGLKYAFYGFLVNKITFIRILSAYNFSFLNVPLESARLGHRGRHVQQKAAQLVILW